MDLNWIVCSIVTIVLLFVTIYGWCIGLRGLFGFYFEDYKIYKGRELASKNYNPYFNLIRFIVGFILACPFWLVEVIKPQVLVIEGVREQARIVRNFDKPAILWQKEWYALVNAPGRRLVYTGNKLYASARSSFHPITDNPKVRSLRYTIEISTLGGPSGFLELEKALGPIPDQFSAVKQIETKLRYLQFEFNEKHSKELSAFYNPLDEGQQARFRVLVRDFFESPMMGMGARINGTSFSIGD